jgi:hydroxyacylglutathione hydrolase
LSDVRDQDPNAALISTLGLEKEINTFFRLHSPSVIAKLRDAFPDLPEEPEPRVVFLKLRDLRNSW